ncbi:GNAT family N-acetyltransferase [Aliamphritea ceti]|uniref:GNAT family N-acetyltransferase n=1 Tax=Aliamphritea ceti TaxID=1524258 RepID=UPI0021C3D561|nr:GNAT family N-acetyltransferase [Aliamphritea ceti]
MKIIYETARLKVYELLQNSAQADKADLLNQAVEVLSPAVVENLPGYFHGINTVAAANEWLDRMLAESRLFMLRLTEVDTIIGFVFVYAGDNKDAHIGYLLAERYWGKGLASEVLAGLIHYAESMTDWQVLIAGVDKANVASSGLLTKLKFIRQPSDGDSVFYHYHLNR